MYIFSKNAKREKFRLLNESMGCGKAVQQGALAFTLWTGKDAPEQVMYDTLAKEFEE